ncbi:related to extracellular chitinase [Cephalotrichum gorgonifer]|uniref:chitinase n=1 Tax=Cephalotrichum gorgonifer TaxID=2041049 RepID=A0AAE8N4C8_9PEZI|nr:related to extracellular chitinase [Cephalotrichum gorgonifer]
MRFLIVALLALVQLAAGTQPLRCLMYLTGQHVVIPDYALTRHITHVALAFMNSGVFNEEPPQEWSLFTTIPSIRPKFHPGTKFLVAIGGWGDTAGFDVAAESEDSRVRWARNVAQMVEDMEADGVDVDWEYPGGNGEDYKKVPNSEKAWQITAYPLLLQALRRELGPHKLITAALPGLERDMLAFTPATIPQIVSQLDFVNVMTYDLFNRRDNVTKHHTGIALSRASINAYISRGAPADKLNLGFPFYVKWALTEPCPDPENPVGCPTLLMEDPETGADLGRAGGFSFHDEVPSDLAPSYNRALAQGKYDRVGGGHYYWDEGENRWWTFDTPEAIRVKFPVLVEGMGLGGVFAWGLGEDAPEFAHLEAVDGAMEKLRGKENAKRDAARQSTKEL